MEPYFYILLLLYKCSWSVQIGSTGSSRISEPYFDEIKSIMLNEQNYYFGYKDKQVQSNNGRLVPEFDPFVPF